MLHFYHPRRCHRTGVQPAAGPVYPDSWGNVIDAVYALLQTPLANITGSLGGFIILLLLAQILWFFGVHGSYTVLAILYPLWFTYLPENTAAAAAGLPIPTCGTPPCTTLPATAAAAAPWVW